MSRRAIHSSKRRLWLGILVVLLAMPQLLVVDADAAPPPGKGNNSPPVAHIVALETHGSVPLSVDFDGGNSSDPDGDDLTYSWDLDGDGVLGDSLDVAPTHVYEVVGSYTITLEVSDGAGTDTDQVTIDANDTERISTNLLAGYDFSEGAGDTVNDVSGVGSPLDLTITDSSQATWIADALVLEGTSIGSNGAATKLIDAVNSAGEFSVEAWLVPADVLVDGVIQIGDSPHQASFYLEDYSYYWRAWETDSPDLWASRRSHVVFTHDSSGTARLYADGVLVDPEGPNAAGEAEGQFPPVAWASTHPLTIAPEGWKGEVHLLAVYDRALSPSEVLNNYEAGRDAPVAGTPSVSWSVPAIQVTAERGTSDLTSLTLVPDGDTSGASVAVDSTISSLLTPAAQRAPFDLVADVVYNVPIVIDVPTTTGLGSHVGDVSIVSSTGQVMGSVSVTVEVVDPPTGTVPPEVSTPSRDRIGTDDAGQPLIKDELVVGLDFGVVDPEQTILDIAAAHNGVVFGSVPDGFTYQLWLPEVADLNELELTRQSVAAEQGVDFASTAYLSRSLSVVPDDPLWDSWDENNPDGNNWNLELIDAPSAWDITTGNRTVPVAIIDGDIDADHVDLAGNIDTYVGEVVPDPRAQSHGTHVAGIACAEGNNGVGVSGVAWQCSLRGYEFGFAVKEDDPDAPMTFSDFAHPAESVFRMVNAADDGARVVNLSVGARRGECLPIDDPNGLAVVEQQNDIWARGVLYAEHIGQDILWVIAAGNWECDARFVTPASLTNRFPRNVITVASANSGGELSSFSNFGDVVAVAAPGGEPDFGAGILSTVRPRPFLGVTIGLPYGEKEGTSMAAPHVTGLAALVLSAHDFSAAQTKACIVAGAEDNGIPLAGHAFSVIDAPSAIHCEGTVALPPEVDLVFSLDLTGSMSQEIDQIKLQINEIMAGLRDAAPDTDFQFGVVSYEDYNGTFDSSICPDSTYNSFYGGGSDEPFRIDLALTGDDPTVAQTINNLTLGGGGDGPQSYGRVFWEVSQADTMGQLGFRPEALKLLVDFGDNVPHDADLNEGIEPPLEPPFPSPFDTGYDPGRNDVIDCGADDIDFQDDAIPAMVGSDVHLVHIDSSGSSSLEVYWNLWTSQTGGEFAAINSDGTVPEGQDLTQLIIELLQLIP